MGIWLNDGSFEPMLGDTKEAFGCLIRERLGVEAEDLFKSLTEFEYTQDDVDDAYNEGYEEGYADGCEQG